MWIKKSTDFESFADGDITGQDAWDTQVTGSQYLVGPGGKSGKGLSFDTDPAASSWAWKPLGFSPNATTSSILVASIDISAGRFSPNAGGDVTSRFGLDIYNGDGDRVTAATLRFAGGSTTQAQLSTYLSAQTNYNVTLNADSWHNLRIELDTVANSASYFLDNALVASGTYTTDDSVIGDVDVYSSAIGYDIGKFDNLSVQAVPEPASMAALGLGLAAVARRRSRRK